MLTHAMGLHLSLLLLGNHHSYPEGKAIHVRVMTETIPHPSSNYHPLNNYLMLVIIYCSRYTWPVGIINSILQMS